MAAPARTRNGQHHAEVAAAAPLLLSRLAQASALALLFPSPPLLSLFLSASSLSPPSPALSLRPVPPHAPPRPPYCC